MTTCITFVKALYSLPLQDFFYLNDSSLDLIPNNFEKKTMDAIVQLYHRAGTSLISIRMKSTRGTESNLCELWGMLESR